MGDLDIVITMGGIGSRFRKIGHTVPKYMIEAKGKTLFTWSMLSLEGFKDIVCQYIFIVKRDENIDAETYIKTECNHLGLLNCRIIVIDELTDGQASTAMLARKYWHKEHKLLIYNIDTYVEAGIMNSKELKGDGFLPCFQAEGDHWSFVKINAAGQAVEIREKSRISDYCTVGAYYFRTCDLYERLYFTYYGGNKHLVNGEKYVAPLYDYLIRNGGEVFISNIPPEKVHVLGTPEELEAFLNE